ncbi:hypothetical protein JCM9279_004017 [Rhodotorula babjevae]
MPRLSPGAPQPVAPHPAHLDAPHDPLLHRLLVLFGWFLPSLDWRIRQRVDSASVSFTNDWGKLLPEEREAAVDMLVGMWCAFTADSKSLDPAQLGYQKMWRTIKVVKSTQPTAMHELSVLRGLAVAIERTFPLSSAGVVEQWKRALLGETDITVSKLLRSDSSGWNALRHGLESVPELVGLLEQVGDSPALALPSADLLLEQAHTASQSSTDRFHIFSRSLKNLVTLYRALPPHAASLAAHDEQASLVRTVLVLADDTAAFGRLGTERQVAAVGKGRDAVYEAAQARQEAGRLPSLHVLLHELREALKPDDPTSQHSLAPRADFAASLGTSTAPLVWLPPHTPHDPPPDDAQTLSLGRPGPRSVYFPLSRAVQY